VHPKADGEIALAFPNVVGEEVDQQVEMRWTNSVVWGKERM